jgi:hypothetical protein
MPSCVSVCVECKTAGSSIPRTAISKRLEFTPAISCPQNFALEGGYHSDNNFKILCMRRKRQ